ncbi:hypothetical protein STEG23_015924 [Scotinomys teguina]
MVLWTTTRTSPSWRIFGDLTSPAPGSAGPTGGPASFPANQPVLAPARNGARAAAGERLEQGTLFSLARPELALTGGSYQLYL